MARVQAKGGEAMHDGTAKERVNHHEWPQGCSRGERQDRL